MASLGIYQGKYREVLPLIYANDAWQSCVPWVFTEGLWRRTFDPGFVNLINNSRLINGTDISVSQGRVSGVAPVSWTLGTISTGSSYSNSGFTERDQVKSIRFVTEQSRHYYIARVQVTEGTTYTASAFVEQINIRNARKVLAVVGESATIDIDVDFPNAANIKLGHNEIQFYARTSGIVQFRMGSGVDQSTDGDVTISRPQVINSFTDMEWQPTPIIAPYYDINMINSYMTPERVISYTDGEYNLDMTIRVESDFSRPVMLIGRQESSGFNGIGFDKSNLYVYRTGSKDKTAALSKQIPIKRLVGLKLIWRKTGNYVTDIRLYLNGELIARIPTTLYSGNIDSLFGYSANTATNITIQNFSLSLDKVYAFSVDEGSGNILHDISKSYQMKIAGAEKVDFFWIDDLSPPIVTSDVFDQTADIGAYARMFADATFYITVQWYKNGEPIRGAISPELIFNSVQESDYGDYYCVFENEFGKAVTSIARLKSPNDKTERLVTEKGEAITTEDNQIIITEV